MPLLVPEFDNVCAIVAPELALAPVTPDCVTVHAKLAPATPDVNEIDGAVPPQMDCEAGVAITAGVGFTVITTVADDPLHELAVGVMVYVAVPALVPEFDNVCAMVAPELALAPVIPAL